MPPCRRAWVINWAGGVMSLVLLIAGQGLVCGDDDLHLIAFQRIELPLDLFLNDGTSGARLSLFL